VRDRENRSTILVAAALRDGEAGRHEDLTIWTGGIDDGLGHWLFDRAAARHSLDEGPETAVF